MHTVLKRVFTHEYRAEAVKRVLAEGLGVTQAARKLGYRSRAIRSGYRMRALVRYRRLILIACNR